MYFSLNPSRGLAHQRNSIELKSFREFENPTKCEKWGRVNFQDWANSLRPLERSVIRRYSDGEFREINRYLRGKDEGAQTEAGTIPMGVEKISAALDKTCLPQNIVVYRGTCRHILDGHFGNEPEDFVGQVLTEKGFLSTSLLEKEVLSFHSGIILKIQARAGARGAFIGGISVRPTEQEVLFDKGQKLLITGVQRYRYHFELHCNLL